MEATAIAPGAGTILNALATGRGSAFAIDRYTEATVMLEAAAETEITGHIDEAPSADTRLIEACVEEVIDRYGEESYTGRVETSSEIPMAAGLKSSSAAANATILATLEAIGVEDVSREVAARLGVNVARDVGVTITGAFDDASASMLGGITITDNEDDQILRRDHIEWDVLVWTPPEQAFSAEADIERCRRIAPVAELVEERAMEGDYGRAMTINGLAYAAALEFPSAPILEALPEVTGVSLSGTGPSYVAIGEEEVLRTVRQRWEQRPGTTWLTRTQTDGARTK